MKQEIEDLIRFAEKEGHISGAESWTDKEKEDYYDKCMAFEPDEEE